MEVPSDSGGGYHCSCPSGNRKVKHIENVVLVTILSVVIYFFAGFYVGALMAPEFSYKSEPLPSEMASAEQLCHRDNVNSKSRGKLIPRTRLVTNEITHVGEIGKS